jgi:hypothetical protein
MTSLGLPRNSDGIPFQPSFFAKSASRSYFFVADTVFLLGVLSILGYLLTKYWGNLPSLTVVWLALAGASLMLLWVLALRCYRRVHEVFRSGAADSVPDDSPLGISMSVAAAMIHWGLFFACFAAAGILMQFVDVLSGRP